MVVLVGAGVTVAAVAIRGHHWRHLSGKDALTGLANRAWFEERFEEEMSRAHRSEQPLSLAIVDLDGFRELNSAHGHAGGDLALRVVARRLPWPVAFASRSGRAIWPLASGATSW